MFEILARVVRIHVPLEHCVCVFEDWLWNRVGAWVCVCDDRLIQKSFVCCLIRVKTTWIADGIECREVTNCERVYEQDETSVKLDDEYVFFNGLPPRTLPAPILQISRRVIGYM